MKRYIVTTERGDWRDIWATSAEAAKIKVERISGGRCGRVLAAQAQG